ncbi:hypothetical protein [Ralstonia pickettii]|uniref:hypothetical protein n=1 Tax=Ralstonia pickettii TaxID=329 RepID=UPI0015B7FC6C|nr:hypothetical protein [Ralstonia pickettii]NWK42871.1 hypothetical protein [Ralstonia pickettii]
MFNCKGDDAKKKLLAQYDFEAVSRVRIAHGVIVKGCCGDLEDVQVIFAFKKKDEKKFVETIPMGEHCARVFLDLMNQADGQSRQLPTLVNPYVELKLGTGNAGTGGNSSNSSGLGGASSGKTIPPLNQELYSAISLWFALRGKEPKYAVAELLVSLRDDPYSLVETKRVIDFLKLVASYRKSLKQIIAEHQAKYPQVQMKPHSFPHLNAVAQTNWIDLP